MDLSQEMDFDLKQLMAEYERTLIRQALVSADGHQRRAARALGILPTTLHEKMKRLGIPTRTGILRAEPHAGQAEASRGVEAA